MKKAMVYPYNKEFSPILRHKELLKQYEIVSLVAPYGWGTVGKDCACVDGGGELHIKINENFQEELNKCDIVIICDYNLIVDFNTLIMPKINKSISEGKDILCMCHLDEKIYKEIEQKCRNKGVNFIYFGLNKDPNFCEQSVGTNKKEQMFDFEVPIIFVLSMSEGACKFETQLRLIEDLQNTGYKVSGVGSRQYCEHLGFNSFPEFMINAYISEKKKIISFNNFVKKIEIDENPDVIIIGIPGAIMSHNDKILNDFGVLAYEVSNSVYPDAAVLNILYEEYDNEDLKKLINSIKYKFGFEIDCFNMAPIKGKANEGKGKLDFITLDTDFIEKKKKKLNDQGINVYNALSIEDSMKMMEFLVDKLSTYSNVQQF